MTQESTNQGIVTSLRLTAEEHQALKALADREHRSLNGQLRQMIRAATQLEAAA